jgi:hypothetical protein
VSTRSTDAWPDAAAADVSPGHADAEREPEKHEHDPRHRVLIRGIEPALAHHPPDDRREQRHQQHDAECAERHHR